MAISRMFTPEAAIEALGAFPEKVTPDLAEAIRQKFSDAFFPIMPFDEYYRLDSQHRTCPARFGGERCHYSGKCKEHALRWYVSAIYHDPFPLTV